jgi:hypothetical protein
MEEVKFCPMHPFNGEMGQVLGCSYAIMNRKTWKEIKFKNNFFSV